MGFEKPQAPFFCPRRFGIIRAMKNAREWYVKTADGNVYGPADVASLVKWAEDGRIDYSVSISKARVSWSPAHLMLELAMDWLVEVEPGRVLGPYNRRYLIASHREGAFPPETRIYRRHEFAVDVDPTPRVMEKVVEKIVEKKVEVPVEKIVEKRVEVPVEKIVEKRVEVPVDRIVEKIVEKKVEVPVEKIVVKEVPVEKVVEKIVEKCVEVPVDRTVEKIVEKRVEVPVEKIVVKKVPVEKIVEKIVEKRVEVPVEKIVVKEVPVEKIVEKIVEVPVEKIVVKEVPVEKIVEVERPVEAEVVEAEVVEPTDAAPPPRKGGIFGGADRSRLVALEEAARRELAAAGRGHFGFFGRK